MGDNGVFPMGDVMDMLLVMRYRTIFVVFVGILLLTINNLIMGIHNVILRVSKA